MRALATHQMVRNHVRLKALIQTTRTAPSKQRGSCSWILRMLANTTDGLSHRNMKDPLQCLRLTSAILCFASVVD